MRIQEIVEIVRGELCSLPSISSVSHFTHQVARVQRGDLFLALEKTPKEIIAQAVEAGAYGIIFEGECEVLDSEIAWIRVDSLQDCLIRLIRYKLLAKSITTISLSPIQEAIAQEIITDKRVIFASHTTHHSLKMLLDTQNTPEQSHKQKSLAEVLELLNNQEADLLLTSDESVLGISFEVLEPCSPKDSPFLILSHTLFDSTIFYQSLHYRVNLPKMFLGDLGVVLGLCQDKALEHDLSRFKHIPHFKPNFLNALGRVIEYGQASKVAIAEPDIECFKRYMAYIANNAAWGKFLFLVPQVYVELFGQIAQAFAYESEQDLCERIRGENFNFALVLGIDDDALVHALNSTQKQPIEQSLFSELWDSQ